MSVSSCRGGRGGVSDIVGLYLNPPEAAVVYCVDELGRAGARHCLDEQRVSPTRPPNPACASPRTGLSTERCQSA